jgi:probable F420-dependent oxidoreductase
MTTATIDIGRVGLWTATFDAVSTAAANELANSIEQMGWPTVWRPEVTGRDALVSAAHLLGATRTLKVATGIAQIYARHPHTARAAQRTLHEASGGRFLLGLGVSHRPHVEGSRKLDYSRPFTDMVAYLEAMAEAPFTAVAAHDEPPTVLAALGPKMTALAGTAADGAHPYFSPVEHTARARQILGEGPLLAPEQMVVLDTDRTRAHQTAATYMARYLPLPNYANNLLRFGFTPDDLSGPSPRLIDALVACGDVDDVVRRVADQHAAGADHVCIQVLTTDPRQPPVAEWQRLADAFSL